MSRHQSHINTAVKVIESYKGDNPFAIFIKAFFSEHKKYGSKDRKAISSLCYNYFRLGFAAKGYSIEDKILLGCFLCGNEATELLAYKKPEWNAAMQLPVDEKLAFIGEGFSIAEIFPFEEELSKEVGAKKFAHSFLIQPDLFVRIRPNEKAAVLQKLKNITGYTLLKDDTCIEFENATKVDELFSVDKEVVIQDYNSQQVFNYLPAYLSSHKIDSPAVWDCCAASGGKSILINDLLKEKIKLTVSDIRESILINLRQRFTTADIKSYKHFVADISKSGFKHPATEQDIILCDVPCTGSGTWSRTPEQLCFFKPATIATFSNRQQQIVANVLPSLKKEGLLVYITCSVFKKENEDVVNYLQEKLQLQLLHQEVLKGYDSKADTMFVAILQKVTGY
jgi:16S rRNA (cytosine967-C5)-methyltransferase